MNATPTVLPRVGRIRLAALFVGSGFGKIAGCDRTAACMASAGLPLVSVLLPLTIAIEFGGGLALAAGWFARPVAGLLALFTIAVTLAFHHFRDLPAAQAAMPQIHFMKNLSIIGGLPMVCAFGPGAIGVDARRRTTRRSASSPPPHSMRTATTVRPLFGATP